MGSAVLRMVVVALRELMPLFGKEWAQDLLRALLVEMEQSVEGNLRGLWALRMTLICVFFLARINITP